MRLWQTVTVQSAPSPPCIISAAIGLPTMLLRPSTTHSAPRVSTPLRRSSSCTPAGVQGAKPSRSPISSLPTFTGWKPSTSFRGRMRRITSAERICGGRGIWTRMPWIAGSAFRRSTAASSASSVVSAGSRRVTECMPASWQARPFART